MNKNAIFNYVEFAREELQKLVRQKAFEYGITEKGAESNVLIVNGRLLTKEESTQRNTLISTIESKSKNKFAEGYEIVMEEVSYTWFNRFIALRFMEVNGYLPSHTRVFSDDLGKFNPQILKEALTLDIYGIDRLKVSEMLQHNQSDELFKYLLILQCNALSKPMPKMFEKIDNYTELLFPNGLLKKGSIIEKLVNDIPEEDWKEQVQIIGWMYQFYISKKKDEVFASKKTITKNTIGAVTQLFTPDWIVRYMAENSIGRIWLESYPDSPLKSEMKYYVDDAKQEEHIKQKIEEIKYKNVEPDQIKIIEPCCGSGHILVYCFDLLYQMYLEKGYSPKDIASLILKNNLWGLDVDERAVQLAYFSVMMKARSVDRQYLIRDVVQQPRIYELLDSELLVQNEYEDLLKTYNFTEQSINIAKYLVSTFKNGKVIGSLLKVKKYDYKVLVDDIKEKMRTVVPNLMDQNTWFTILPELKKLAQLAMVLSRKYDVMITNPPYLGSASLETACKDYANKEYPNSKTDMFAMFMEAGFAKDNGFNAMINMHSWMFLKSYEQLRRTIIDNSMIVNMIHLGAHAFEDIGGEVVQTTSFVIRKSKIASNGVYFRLVDEKDKESAFLSGGGIVTNLKAFKTIPSNIFAYWISDQLINVFAKSKQLSILAEPKQGLATSDNNRFLRLWYEVCVDNLFLTATDYINAMFTGKTWFPYNKGGEFRKWYGNNDYVVNWKDNGKEIRNVVGSNGKIASRAQNTQYYFRQSITWSKISCGRIAFRYKPQGHIFDVAGTSIFNDNEEIFVYLLGLLNTKLMQHILDATSPTINYEVGQIANLPIIINNKQKEEVIKLTNTNTYLSKNDWDKFEVSWDFKKHPLI